MGNQELEVGKTYYIDREGRRGVYIDTTENTIRFTPVDEVPYMVEDDGSLPFMANDGFVYKEVPNAD